MNISIVCEETFIFTSIDNELQPNHLKQAVVAEVKSQRDFEDIQKTMAITAHWVDPGFFKRIDTSNLKKVYQKLALENLFCFTRQT